MLENLTIIILTYNEELHIERALKCAKRLTNNIIVIDSYSTDNTTKICQHYNVKVYFREFDYHAAQFNWVLDNVEFTEGQWILRLDADEYFDELALKNIMGFFLRNDLHKYKGLVLRRRIKFQGKLIKWGGIFPISVTRGFVVGHGRYEDILMDEHLLVSGRSRSLDGEIIDDNLRSLDFWMSKHVSYANKEALKQVKNVQRPGTQKVGKHNIQVRLKRLVKKMIYDNLPAFWGPFLYVIYRLVFRLGVLDGPSGVSFHILQGFWYRYIVNLKIKEQIKSRE